MQFYYFASHRLHLIYSFLKTVQNLCIFTGTCIKFVFIGIDVHQNWLNKIICVESCLLLKFVTFYKTCLMSRQHESQHHWQSVIIVSSCKSLVRSATQEKDSFSDCKIMCTLPAHHWTLRTISFKNNIKHVIYKIHISNLVNTDNSKYELFLRSIWHLYH